MQEWQRCGCPANYDTQLLLPVRHSERRVRFYCGSDQEPIFLLAEAGANQCRLSRRLHGSCQGDRRVRRARFTFALPEYDNQGNRNALPRRRHHQSYIRPDETREEGGPRQVPSSPYAQWCKRAEIRRAQAKHCRELCDGNK